MPQALEYYLQAEQNGWSPPEIQYRIGSAYYQQGQWAPALDRFFAVSSLIPANRRLLNALGNVSYLRGNYFAAQGYYNRLMTLLDTERARFPVLMPNDRPEHLELAERMMVVRNNLAVTLEALTKTTGNRTYRSRALGLYTESARIWDSLTRNPVTMIRAGAGDLSSPGMNLAFLNSRNTLYPEPGYEPQIYIEIDKDVPEPSDWEELVPEDFRLTDLVEPYLPRN
jgi:tetratricopeptide (TPR) repeat protein